MPGSAPATGRRSPSRAAVVSSWRRGPVLGRLNRIGRLRCMATGGRGRGATAGRASSGIAGPTTRTTRDWTWHVSEGKGVHGGGGELFITLDYGAGGAHSCEEPVVTDVSPGHLLMFHRTGLGRFYQSWSADDGANWTQPEPTSLATAQAPAALRHIPGTDDLLLIWNQSSADEIWRGRQRHRLSSAISRDGGATWQHGRNVFSVEDGDGVTTRIEAPPIEYYRAMEHSPRQPPGDLVGTYPYLAFWRDRAIVTFRCFDRSRYLLDAPLPQRPQSLSAAQAGRAVCVSVGLPISWFYA